MTEVKLPKNTRWGFGINRANGTMIDPNEIINIARDGQEELMLTEAVGDTIRRPVCIRCGKRLNLGKTMWECPDGHYMISPSMVRKK